MSHDLILGERPCGSPRAKPRVGSGLYRCVHPYQGMGAPFGDLPVSCSAQPVVKAESQVCLGLLVHPSPCSPSGRRPCSLRGSGERPEHREEPQPRARGPAWASGPPRPGVKVQRGADSSAFAATEVLRKQAPPRVQIPVPNGACAQAPCGQHSHSLGLPAL